MNDCLNVIYGKYAWSDGDASKKMKRCIFVFLQMKIATNVSDNSDEETQHDQDDEKKMVELRKKFLDQCLKYTGVPYKRKYHAPGSARKFVF